MLGKLMKYELRATGRWMLPLYGVTILLALGANICSRFMADTEFRLLWMIGAIINAAFGFAITALGVVTVAMMVYRFKTNLLGDEGYVMHTLPASIHQHIWSKLIVSILWYIASALVLVLGLFLATTRLVYFRNFVWSEFWGDLGRFIQTEPSWHLFLLELIGVALLVCLGACLIFYAAMALGHSFTNHKTLLSILFFFGFQFVLQFIIPFLMIFVSDQMNFSLDHITKIGEITMAHQLMGLLLVLGILIDGIFYAITAHSMKRRLNLG